MAAAPQCSQAAAKAGLDALLAKLNIGGAAGVIKIFNGSPPANCEAADTGTLLATLGLSATAFPASANNASPRGAIATANAISDDTSADATGTAGYFRAYSWDGASTYVCVVQGNCGTAGADMILNTTSIVQFATISCSSWTVTLPDGG